MTSTRRSTSARTAWRTAGPEDWTGWHRLEKALWQDKKIGDREKELADLLVTDLTDWQKRVGKAEITPTSMANGAKELLDEVATGKVTGEEERYSPHRPGRLQGQRRGRRRRSYELLKPVAAENDAGAGRRSWTSSSPR